MEIRPPSPDDLSFEIVVSRRGLIKGAAAAGVALVAAVSGARFLFRSPPDVVAGFERLSRVVTGVDDLPAGLARKYLKALDGAGLEMKPSRLVHAAGYATGDGPQTLAELEGSSAFRAPGAKECVGAIAGAWWSGSVLSSTTATVVTYLDALVWRAMPYAGPPSECLGVTGVWALPPEKAG